MAKNSKEPSISFLFGAGFSAPMGYPIGNQLNEKIRNSSGEEFSFNTDGSLMIDIRGIKPNIGYKTQFDIYHDFCKDLIEYYHSCVKDFNYEEFYDYIKSEECKKDLILKELFMLNNYRRNADLDDFLFQIDNIYNQVVSFYLSDGNFKNWYDDAPYLAEPGTINGYKGFLECIRILKKDFILNFHTLNHDLFLSV